MSRLCHHERKAGVARRIDLLEVDDPIDRHRQVAASRVHACFKGLGAIEPAVTIAPAISGKQGHTCLERDAFANRDYRIRLYTVSLGKIEGRDTTLASM